MTKVVVTGSSGLIGLEAVSYFDAKGCDVVGFDNNMRKVFFGDKGDTSWNLARLQRSTKRFEHRSIDIRDRAAVLSAIRDTRAGGCHTLRCPTLARQST